MLRYGIFALGLSLAGVSFLVYLGNALALERASRNVARSGILGMIAGSVIAGAGIILAAVLSSRLVPLASVIVGGLAGSAGGWLLGSLLFHGGNWNLEWMVAVCLIPIGMWLGLLAVGRGTMGKPGPGDGSGSGQNTTD
jgi:hypothetical protein